MTASSTDLSLNRKKIPRVLLITMPWQSAETPSIQLGVLKSCLENAGIEADCLYGNLLFAETIGFDQYANFAGSIWYTFVREWLFSGFMPMPAVADEKTIVQLMDVFSNNPITKHARIKDRFGNVLEPELEVERYNRDGDTATTYFGNLRTQGIPGFFKSLLNRVDFGGYTMIGFTCGFSQLIPPLGLAATIKHHFPQCTIVFGGSGVHGDPGQAILKHFPQVDFVCQGDGEEDIVAMARGSYTGEPSTSFYSLDLSPTPNYKDYFSQLLDVQTRNPGLGSIYDGSIPYESSRGCLWAAKTPCAFCALNGTDLLYRTKSHDRVLTELLALINEYSPTKIAFVDNLMNVRHQKSVFEVFRSSNLESSFFLEVRPTLNRKELELARNAGVAEIQTGVEAFSTELQRLIGKGTTLERSLQFLGDCSDLGIDVHYNCLIGIPGESAEHYKSVLALIPTIMHLPPPAIPLTPISLQRNSPYWLNPKKYGIANIRPARQYEHIFPPHLLADLSLVFDFDLHQSPDYVGYINELIELTLTWRTVWDAKAKTNTSN